MTTVRVLIVDDSAVIRRVLREALASDAMVEVAGIAADGLSALKRIEETKPDLVTLDAELRNLLNEITIGETCLFRSQGQIDALKNVLSPKLVEERGKLGLKKLRIWSAGCSTGEEPYTLAMFLNEEREKRYPQWNFEVMVMDRLSHSVHRCGHAIDLSPKEFALLEFLMRHAGHPVSRSTIVEQVWRLNVETMTNVVDVYVNYLRRKVDAGYDRRLIRTVRGTGYQIGTNGLVS
jgi:DNA-binding response OmpR family regulator